MPASVITGIPMLPNATGAVLASKQMPAAKKGSKPNPASMPAATATGAPNPAAPSIKAPNENAIRRACRRRSAVRLPMESLMMSKLPVSTVMRYRTIAQNRIQQIGKQSKCRAVQRCADDERKRHPIDEHRDEDRGRES